MGKVLITLAEVRWFLLENGVEADKIDAAWSKGRAALEDLAGTAGCSLRDEGVVRAAHVAALAKKEEETVNEEVKKETGAVRTKKGRGPRPREVSHA